MPPQSTDKTETHAFTIRLPEDVYEVLRRLAYERRTSINALLVEAARAMHSSPAGSCHVPP